MVLDGCGVGSGSGSGSWGAEGEVDGALRQVRVTVRWGRCNGGRRDGAHVGGAREWAGELGRSVGAENARR